MGLFGNYKPKVSKEEFKKAASSMRSQGLSDADVDKVKMAFSGDIDESAVGDHSGIDAKELQGKIAAMKQNKNVYGLSDDKIKKIEGALKKHL